MYKFGEIFEENSKKIKWKNLKNLNLFLDFILGKFMIVYVFFCFNLT